MAAKQIAEKAISENFVTVFSKSWCAYSKRVKSVLNSYPLDASKVKVFELDHMNEGDEIQAYLAQKTGQRTVPNIFIEGKHVGGCDALLAAQQSGELKRRLHL